MLCGDAAAEFGLITCKIVVWSRDTCGNRRRGAEHACMRWRSLPDASVWDCVRGAHVSTKEAPIAVEKDASRFREGWSGILRCLTQVSLFRSGGFFYRMLQ